MKLKLELYCPGCHTAVFVHGRLVFPSSTIVDYPFVLEGVHSKKSLVLRHKECGVSLIRFPLNNEEGKIVIHKFVRVLCGDTSQLCILVPGTEFKISVIT